MKTVVSDSTTEKGKLCSNNDEIENCEENTDEIKIFNVGKWVMDLY